MDSSVSAFSIYSAQNIKRKPNLNIKDKHAPSKKSKVTKNIAPEFTKEKNRNGVQKVKTRKRKRKTSKAGISKIQNVNGALHSDDEIPILIPIIDKQLHQKTTVKLDKPRQKNSSIEISSEKELQLKKRRINISTTVFNPVIQGIGIFKWIIDPITPKEFFEKYWEKDVLYISRSDTAYFENIFSTYKLDSILREYPLHFTRNIDVVVYENGKKEVFNPEGRAVPSQLWDYYSNGCSIRVLNPQSYDQNIHSIISSLQEYFGTMVGTNLYLTPPGSQGFAPHYDDIEAFIIQLEGKKHWKLYKPKHEDVLARNSSMNFKAEELGPPFMKVTLNAGDVLYFPRGTIHEGHTTPDAHSLHITVSVYQHTAYADLLEQILPNAIKNAAAKDVEFRKGLPLNYLKHLGIVNQNDPSTKREFMVNKVKSLIESLVNYIDVDVGADNLGRKFMHDAMPPLYSNEEAERSSKFDGDFLRNGKVFNRIEIDLDTKIRLLRYYAIRLVKDGDTYKLFYCTDNAKIYHGEEEQWLEIDSSLIPGVATLQKKYPEFIGK